MLADLISEQDKQKFELAQSYSRKGDLPKTLELMQELVDSNPELPVFRAVLANTYWDMEDYDGAEAEFGHAIHLAPEYEVCSLGLFHCLWEQDKREEALIEMKRFRLLAPFKEYLPVLKALAEELPQNDDMASGNEA